MVTKAQFMKIALAFPGAHEDHPWGETAVKVAKKVFVFLGMCPAKTSDEFGLSVKLPESGKMALALPFAEPTHYGLGKSGWVTATFAQSDVPLDLVFEWIEESYRAIAPTRLVRERDGVSKSSKPARAAGSASKKRSVAKPRTRRSPAKKRARRPSLT